METGTKKKRRRTSYRENNEEKEHAAIIDFKMVTFSLGGKDYGIDIMKVSEIAKFEKFTYVPNTMPFVKGVYNLRSDIISLIDLRKMFHLPITEKKEGASENGLILRLEDNMIGIIVDTINKVVGISSETIQPPHPIFGDINIKYISGVVENENRLYIILDVEKIFQKEEKEAAVQHEPAKEPSLTEQQETMETVEPTTKPESMDLAFIKDTLKTFSSFFASQINEDWLENHFSIWAEERRAKGLPVQLEKKEDAQTFLSSFYSPNTGRFWDDDYLATFLSLDNIVNQNSLFIWNPGCGEGYESYSIAAGLVKENPTAKIKIWASDKDLLAISNAPNLVFPENAVPDSLKRFIVEGKNGYSFNDEIKDRILFEYHDILHANTVPEVDIIICRDLISFLNPDDQNSILKEFNDKLKSGSILILGQNEKVQEDNFELIEKPRLKAYRKR